jgi:FtsH-binding integral membrane protein
MPTSPDHNDTWSPFAMRVVLTVLGIVNVVLAALRDGWLRWVLAAIAVLLFCAAIVPPFRRPNR